MAGKRFWMIAAGSVVALLVATFGVQSFGPRSVSPEASVPAEPAPTSINEQLIVDEHAPAATETPVRAEGPELSSPIADQANNPSSSFRELRQCIYASRELISAKHLADCRFYEGNPG